MPKTDHDRTIALAGLLQAASLVDQLARQGYVDDADFNPCIDSLLRIDAPSSAAIYSGVAHLRRGLALIVEHFGPKPALHSRPGPRLVPRYEPMRYAALLMILERRLYGHGEMQQRLRQQIESLALRHHDGGEGGDLEALIDQFALLYSHTISTLSPRIMVQGDQQLLRQAPLANRIRALLLAGIRAAILWRQSGGGRFTLLFRRRALAKEAQRLLNHSDRFMEGAKL